MIRKAQLLKLGPLEYLEQPSEEPEELTLVIFHGYGADAGDLFSLSGEVDVGENVRWVFPNGPIQVPIGPGFYGRAWMQIRPEIIQSMMAGRPAEFSDRRPEGMNDAVERATQFLKKLDVEPSRLMLGGFSQGSMLAVELAASMPEKPAGLIILSGNAIDLEGLKTKGAHLKGLPFFLSHGTQDPILPLVGARKLSGALSALGCKGSIYEFPGGHEIPGPIINELGRFIKGSRKPSPSH